LLLSSPSTVCNAETSFRACWVRTTHEGRAQARAHSRAHSQAHPRSHQQRQQHGRGLCLRAGGEIGGLGVRFSWRRRRWRRRGDGRIRELLSVWEAGAGRKSAGTSISSATQPLDCSLHPV
jgi:hypothetical protein